MLDDSNLSAPVAAALRLAAANRADRRPLTTGRVLSALIQVDIANNWQRIWLYVGDPAVLGLADEPDDPVGPDAAGLRSSGREPELWQGVPLSRALADGLRLMERICRGYRLMPAPGGALALALLADPANGATRALLRSGAVGHAKLLQLVQSELLGTTLEGIDRVIASGQPASRAPAGPPAGGRDAARVAPVTAVDVGRRAGRGAVRRWRLLSAVALALIAIALFWHRQFLPPPTALVVPPYPVPAVAHQVLTTGQLPAAPPGAGGWLAWRTGRPRSACGPEPGGTALTCATKSSSAAGIAPGKAPTARTASR